MERLTEKRDGLNVIPLRQDGKTRWAVTSAGMGNKSTQFLYGTHADKLADYEQAEEDGLLPRFHLGDEFWCLYIDEVVKAKIVTLQQKKDGSWNYTLSREISENYHDIAYYKEREYGKYFWTTKAEAEQALAKMKGE